MKIYTISNEALDLIEGRASQPLTFYAARADDSFAIVRGIRLDSAVQHKRAGYTVAPTRSPIGADFTDYGDRIMLAELGYFSVDLPEHRARRERDALRTRYLEEAYDVLNLDRTEQHALIAARLEGKRFDGIWARSTGEYSAACRRLDEAILAASPAIAKSVDELGV